MTNPGPADVDAIVQAVLAELERRGGGRPDDVFAGRLLGVRQIEAIESEVREVKVAAGTVVTPLAADLLKRRGIAVRRVSVNGSAAREAGEWAFAIEGPATGTTAALRRALADAWSEVAASETLAWVAASAGRGGLLLTPEASVAAWKANQARGIRAALAFDPDAVARAVRHLGVNLLVIEPAGLSIPLVKTMAETYRKAGAPREPGGLR